MFVSETLCFKWFTYTLLVSVNLPRIYLCKCFVKTQHEHTELYFVVFNMLEYNIADPVLQNLSEFCYCVCSGFKTAHQLLPQLQKPEKRFYSMLLFCHLMQQNKRCSTFISAGASTKTDTGPENNTLFWWGSCGDMTHLELEYAITFRESRSI